jgi:hypothetical protein
MNFFEISITSLNLFSFVLGGIWGLSTPVFNRYRSWWWVVGYFAIVAAYYALTAGAINVK